MSVRYKKGTCITSYRQGGKQKYCILYVYT